MARKALRKQLFYKQATFLQPSKLTLQDLLARALKKLKVAKRQESLTEGGADVEGVSGQSWMRFINSPRDYSGLNFGVLTLYSPGKHQLVIDTAIDEEKDELDVSKLAPPAGKQFPEAPLYFGVRENHVVLIQSKAQRTSDFEAHLNWLLVTAGCIDGTQRVELSDVIPEDTRKKLEKAPIKSLSIGAPLVSEPAAGVSDAHGKSMVAAAVDKVAKGIGIDVLKGLLSQKEFSALKLDELTSIPDIQVRLQIKVVGHRKDETGNDEVMRKIMHELRHVDDPSFFQAEVKGMAKLDGSAFRVQAYKPVGSYDGVLDVSDAYEVMRSWLEAIVDSGTIKPS
ncbi:hypothetical protein KGP95_22280 [Burkholderia multivorans]|uniref:hypothetical protein n=1 Tax=Burkholderiaceae TaxID=119060 RepID=UPI00209EAFA5|nr:MULTISPECIES: hypothetical protein [Burkholderiaceae]MCO8613203.1 hypothetical protein [Burkholderia multivorans]MCO8640064.1 hypothetical protein [Burkholderia multivorans]MCO8645127.1 hypothetical protein [Burkholderia multivorans]